MRYGKLLADLSRDLGRDIMDTSELTLEEASKIIDELRGDEE